MKCTVCGSKKVQRRGPRGNAMRFYCLKHHGFFSKQIVEMKSKPKILLIDIETLYMEVKGVWDLKTRYIQPDRIMKDWSVICYAAKWLFEPEVMGESVTPQEAMNRTEESIIGNIWKLLDQADIVVTHNGIDFDIRSINSKLIKNDLPQPSHFLNVDTLVEAKKNFRLPSYKLDYLAKLWLGLDGKEKMSISDWDACATGSQEALDKMLHYCKNDVAPLLEDRCKCNGELFRPPEDPSMVCSYPVF